MARQGYAARTRAATDTRLTERRADFESPDIHQIMIKMTHVTYMLPKNSYRNIFDIQVNRMSWQKTNRPFRSSYYERKMRSPLHLYTLVI